MNFVLQVATVELMMGTRRVRVEFTLLVLRPTVICAAVLYSNEEMTQTVMLNLRMPDKTGSITNSSDVFVADGKATNRDPYDIDADPVAIAGKALLRFHPGSAKALTLDLCSISFCISALFSLSGTTGYLLCEYTFRHLHCRLCSDGPRDVCKIVYHLATKRRY